MKRKSTSCLPVFLIVASLFVVGAWHLGPILRENLPAEVIARFEQFRDSLLGREKVHALPPSVKRKSAAEPTTLTAEELADIRALDQQTMRVAVGEKRKPKKAKSENAQMLAAVNGAPTASEGGVDAAHAQNVQDVANLPALRGVMQADAKTAKWGVSARPAELEGFHHEDMGKVDGGRFFIVERRVRAEEGLKVIGNFYPEPLPQAVVVLAEDFYWFSGSPKDLTEEQRTALKSYYEVRAKALVLRANILKPKYDDDGTRLNAEEDPMQNPQYVEYLNAMKKHAALITGLAF